MNNNFNLPKTLPYSEIPGVDFSEIKEILKHYQQYVWGQGYRLSDGSPGDKDREIRDRIEYEARMRREHPILFDGATALSVKEAVNRKRVKGGQALKLKISDIKLPEFEGTKPLKGLLLPYCPPFGEPPIDLVICKKLRNATCHLTIYKKDGTREETLVMLNVGNYEVPIGTFELGQLLKDSIGITVDLNIKNISPLFDPSSEFEP